MTAEPAGRPSLAARAAIAAAVMTRRRRRYSSAAAVDRLVAGRRRLDAPPPRWLARAGRVSERRCQEWSVFDVVPRRGTPAAGVVVYLHGGSYICGLSFLHWAAVSRLAAAGVRCLVPAYPVAPGATAASTVEAAAGVLDAMCRGAFDAGSGRRPVVAVGDSAGAGLLLAATQRLVAAAGAPPDHLVLLSPWLDLTVDHPDQPSIERRDPVMAGAGLRHAGRLYAGALATGDPLASPLLGPLAGLPPVTVMAGDRDLLVTDARRLAAGVAARGGDVRYRELPGVMHGFFLLGGPEARRAVAEIVALAGAGGPDGAQARAGG